MTIIKGAEEIAQLNANAIKLKHKINSQKNELESYQKNKIKADTIVINLKNTIITQQKTIVESKNETEDKCLFKKQDSVGNVVLYVGGKANLVPYYRELIESKIRCFSTP